MRFLNLICSLLFLLIAGGSALGQIQEPAPYSIESNDLARSITLHPNPATDYITIKLNTLESKTAKLILYNILGNEVQIEKETIDDHEVRLRVKDLSAGYYLLAVRDDQLQFRGTYKFLKR